MPTFLSKEKYGAYFSFQRKVGQGETVSEKTRAKYFAVFSAEEKVLVQEPISRVMTVGASCWQRGEASVSIGIESEGKRSEKISKRAFTVGRDFEGLPSVVPTTKPSCA